MLVRRLALSRNVHLGGMHRYRLVHPGRLDLALGALGFLRSARDMRRPSHRLATGRVARLIGIRLHLPSPFRGILPPLPRVCFASALASRGTDPAIAAIFTLSVLPPLCLCGYFIALSFPSP